MRALENGDSRTALQSIRAAVDVMGEARGYLQLQGEITGELERRQAVVMMVSAGPVAQMTTTQAARVEAEAAIIDIEPGSM